MVFLVVLAVGTTELATKQHEQFAVAVSPRVLLGADVGIRIRISVVCVFLFREHINKDSSANSCTANSGFNPLLRTS